jgi:hypothetical protein
MATSGELPSIAGRDGLALWTKALGTAATYNRSGRPFLGEAHQAAGDGFVIALVVLIEALVRTLRPARRISLDSDRSAKPSDHCVALRA